MITNSIADETSYKMGLIKFGMLWLSYISIIAYVKMLPNNEPRLIQLP